MKKTRQKTVRKTARVKELRGLKNLFPGESEAAIISNNDGGSRLKTKWEVETKEDRPGRQDELELGGEPQQH